VLCAKSSNWSSVEGFALKQGLLGFTGHGMILVFDMDDKARLPWRFFGAGLALFAVH
jgi:hypothetical protein